MAKHAGQSGPQFLQAAPLQGGHRHDGGLFQKTAPHLLAEHFHGESYVFCEVGFGQGDDGSCHAQITENLQVFFRLRHPSVIGRHDKKSDIKGRDPGHHVADKVGMTRYIHYTQTQTQVVLLRIDDFKMGETEFDRHAALPLFW